MKNQTSFSSTHQPTKRRGRSKRNQLLEAMRAEGITEKEFWQDVLRQARAGEMSAMSLVASRLQPAYRPETRPIEPGLIDGAGWAELSHSSKVAMVAYLMAMGQISAENGAALTKALNDGSALTADYYDTLINVREAEDVGDRAKLSTQKHLYELSTKFTEDIKKDLARLQRAIEVQDNGDIHIADDQSDDSSEPEQDNSEPLVATSLHDVVQAQNSTDTTSTNDNTGDNGSAE